MKPKCLSLLGLSFFLQMAVGMGQAVYVIKNVSIIPMNREVVLQNQSVIIVSGKIRQVADAATIKSPAGAKIIDGSGKYLMPGLFDMHAHFFTSRE